MTMMGVKDPSDKLDYAVDWDQWLESGESITDVDWTVETGLTKASDPTESNTAKTATVWLEGGSNGEDYTVACKITTSAGRIVERSFVVQVRNR